jgi:hypothetical protein
MVSPLCAAHVDAHSAAGAEQLLKGAVRITNPLLTGRRPRAKSIGTVEGEHRLAAVRRRRGLRRATGRLPRPASTTTSTRPSTDDRPRASSEEARSACG